MERGAASKRCLSLAHLDTLALVLALAVLLQRLDDVLEFSCSPLFLI